MLKISSNNNHWLLLITLGMLAVNPAFADKPSWAGGAKHGKQDKHPEPYYEDGYYNDGRSNRDYGRDIRIGVYFDAQQHAAVRDYYAREFHAGHCPPGLAKKHNGCLPPGQAKKWALGRPLPRDVDYYPLPPQVAMQIGLPPEGYEIVRVASDILMIAIGTGMVVDAIADLGGL